jgi:hypothetical protein
MLFTKAAKFILHLAAIFVPSISMAATLDDCGHISKLRIQGNEIVVCSRGDLFSVKGNIVKGDGLVIYQTIGNRVIQLRDLTDVSPTVEEVVTVKTDETRIMKITVTSSELPDWKTVPLFDEIFDFGTKTSTLHPLRKIRRFDRKDAERRFSEINKAREDIFKNAKKARLDYLSVLYEDLFVLRDYAFSKPALIETYYNKLQHLDWLDGRLQKCFQYFTLKFPTLLRARKEVTLNNEQGQLLT